MEKDLLSTKKDELIEKLTENLPTIRAKMKISQSELADSVRIGRQTIISIENKNSKMRWDTFLALMLIISQSTDASELLHLLGLNINDIGILLQDDISLRKSKGSTLQDKIWTDNNYSGDCTIRGIVHLPIGYINGKCKKCSSKNIKGVLIMPTADEQDPNLVCLDCGYWWD